MESGVTRNSFIKGLDTAGMVLGSIGAYSLALNLPISKYA
jgi:hypothetical protein